MMVHVYLFNNKVLGSEKAKHKRLYKPGSDIFGETQIPYIVPFLRVTNRNI